MPQVVTRGLLVDIADAGHVDRLAAGDVIIPADAERALAAGGLGVEPVFHTGWGSLWGRGDPKVPPR